MSKNYRLSTEQTLNMADFLRGTQEDNKIPLRAGALAKKVSHFLSFPVNPASVIRVCDSLKIEIIRNAPAKSGNDDPLAARVAELEATVTCLGKKVAYLLTDMYTPDGCTGSPPMDEVQS